MYSMALVMWSFDLTNFVREVQTTLIDNPEGSMADKYAIATHLTFSLVAPEDLLYAYMTILGDGIVVWRVYALWRGTTRAWVAIFPVALLLGSLAHLGTAIVDGSFQNPAFCKNVQTASYSMATVTTAVATILIAWKSWEYRLSIKPMVSRMTIGRATRVERFMVLLIESGVLYFLFFLVQVIGNIPGVESHPRLSFAFYVYSFSTSVVVGIYPTAVIILAHSDNAVLDTAVASTLTPSTTNYTSSKGHSGLGSRRANDLELSAFSVTTHTTTHVHVDEVKPRPLVDWVSTLPNLHRPRRLCELNRIGAVR
ncbi:hypothetical protein H0H92_014361 [Tricholoma furcatifolium]|nr:hypothetical protein H0H92_014361 [Tricholoma furcatifolium]